MHHRKGRFLSAGERRVDGWTRYDGGEERHKNNGVSIVAQVDGDRVWWLIRSAEARNAGGRNKRFGEAAAIVSRWGCDESVREARAGVFALIGCSWCWCSDAMRVAMVAKEDVARTQRRSRIQGEREGVREAPMAPPKKVANRRQTAKRRPQTGNRKNSENLKNAPHCCTALRSCGLENFAERATEPWQPGRLGVGILHLARAMMPFRGPTKIPLRTRPAHNVGQRRLTRL